MTNVRVTLVKFYRACLPILPFQRKCSSSLNDYLTNQPTNQPTNQQKLRTAGLASAVNCADVCCADGLVWFGLVWFGLVWFGGIFF
jgi:hypothetical protein